MKFKPNDYRWAKAKDVNLADHLIQLKKEENVWVVIDFIVKSWKRRKPDQYKTHIFNVKALRETRADEFGSNRKIKKRASHMDMRYLASIPQWIILVIRKLYTVKELPMDKKFLRAFSKRYPKFRVAEKL